MMIDTLFRNRLLGLAPCVVTPLVELRARLTVKDESKQVSGAFKYRGIRNKVAALPEGTRIVTASTGNHAAGLARAARDHGCEFHAFVPETTSTAKLERITRCAGRVHKVRGDYDACAELAIKFGLSHQAFYVHSFDDPLIIQGHRQLFAEIERVTPRPDVAFVPIGGGGLVSAAIEEWGGGRTRIIGVEHESAPAMAAAIKAGHPVKLPSVSGHAEGLLVRRVGNNTFKTCASYGLTVETVGDREIRSAIRVLYAEAGIRAEYAGAAAVAAALRHTESAQQALCIVTGGNIDENLWRSCVERS